MASPSIPLLQLDDISECPICTEVYTDPRVLPCIHTYCLKCIDGWCKDKLPGDQVACPLCRKEFTIPSDGPTGLPKNFFIGKLLMMRELASSKSLESPCDVCSIRNDVPSKNVAKSYCLDCEEKLCESCDAVHRCQKVSRSHKIVKLGEEIKQDDTAWKHSATRCSVHEDESVKLYCVECKSVICMLCYAESHNAHACSNINKMSEEFRQQMKSDLSSVLNGIETWQYMLKNVKTKKDQFIEQIREAEERICEKAEELKSMIESHKKKLLDELGTTKQTTLKEIDSLSEEVERHLMSVQSIEKYVSELLKKGTSCDIVRAASGLHERAQELLVFDLMKRALDDLEQINVTFTPSNLSVDDPNSTVGEVALRRWQEKAGHGHNQGASLLKSNSSPTQTTILTGANQIYAVTSLGDDVFIALCNTEHVEVYDSTNLKLQRRLRIPGAGSAMWGLVACNTNNCLYVSDYNSARVHRVELSGSNAVTAWGVDSNPIGLSVNRSHNVLVASGTGTILEYSTLGTKVRTISLQAGSSTWHCVQLSSGQFVVSKYTNPGSVLIVDQFGRTIHRVDKHDGKRLGAPSGIVVTENDEILVCDTANSRILVLNSSLSEVKQLPLPVSLNINQSYGLCLDESRGRLYVAHTTGQRVLVFDNLW